MVLVNLLVEMMCLVNLFSGYDASGDFLVEMTVRVILLVEIMLLVILLVEMTVLVKPLVEMMVLVISLVKMMLLVTCTRAH